MEATEAAQTAQDTATGGADPAPEPAPAPVDAPRRRTGRTVALIAVAAVLGIVGGTAVGYGIQAQREPTALPALNQPDLVHPAKPLPGGQEPEPLSMAQDRGLKTEGDLRKLLPAKPAGAKKAEWLPDDGWLSVAAYADSFERPSEAFDYLLRSDVRRIAATGWRTGRYKTTEINLVQFRGGGGLSASEHADYQRRYLTDDSGYGNPIKGSAEGRTYLMPVHREEGYLDSYQARAIFHRGDVMVEIFVTDTKKISQKEITSLAERQLERL
ncbi:hypothetical protein ACH414_14295 [Streptomyces sp. NPDC020422]|uniref:hypothetical protein n=1 Tax=Streptomyces sp. NPDC020422 TaxID=3365074 RepID=UPI0037ADBFEA